MVMKFIKKEQKPGDQPIKKLIHESLAGWKNQPHELYPVHASSLTYDQKAYCPRAVALMMKLKKKPKAEFVSTSLQVTFDHGNAMQGHLNNEYLPDTMVGRWKCKSCGKTKGLGLKPKTQSCVHGGTNIHCQWDYVEVKLHDPQAGTTGSIDAFVRVTNQKLRMAEVKTIVKDEFKGLLAPKAEHTLRTRMYLYFIAKFGGPLTKRTDTEEASVLYMVKGFGIKDLAIEDWGITDAKFSPYKEFPVKRNDEELVPYLSMGKTVRIFKETGKMPCRLCNNPYDARARRCQVVKQCFGKGYPLELTWIGLDGNPVHPDKPVVEYEL